MNTDRKIEPIDDDLWCFQSHFVIWGCRGSLRMTLVRTPIGVVIHSPVALARGNIDAIGKLGEVTAIIAPNLYHHMFLRPCIEAFPGTRVLVPAGLEAKIGPIPRAETMHACQDLRLPPEIESFVFAGHNLNETILFHRPTRTLITADLLYNFQPENFAAEKAFFRTIGCYGSPKVAFYHRFSIRQRSAIHDLIATVRSWQPLRIIMCHGRIVESEDAGEIFAKAWRRFA